MIGHDSGNGVRGSSALPTRRVMRLLIFSIIFTASFSAQADDLVVLGRLETIEESVPYCGDLITGAVAEYGVLKVISGNYVERRIFVVHPCIEMQRPKLIVGNVYKVTLTQENVNRIEVFSRKRIPKKFTTYFSRVIELQR